VRYAQRGTRNLDRGEEALADRTLADALRRKARNLYIISAAGAALVAVGCWLLRLVGS
jgi:hypothetical protein